MGHRQLLGLSAALTGALLLVVIGVYLADTIFAAVGGCPPGSDNGIAEFVPWGVCRYHLQDGQSLVVGSSSRSWWPVVAIGFGAVSLVVALVARHLVSASGESDPRS